LWEAERVVRPTGDLFAMLDEDAPPVRVGRDTAQGQVPETLATADCRLPTAESVSTAESRLVPPKPTGEGGFPTPDAVPKADLSRRSLDDDREAKADSEQAKAEGGLPTAEGVSTADCPLPTADRVGDSPLPPMTPMERIVADYQGSGVTIGPHPMTLRRADLRLRGVLRSDELVRTRGGRRVRVAGAVITRQRPGTAKGMVFLTLEDEAGLANIIVRPDVFDRQRALVMRAPFLVVEGVLQQLEGVTSVRAERVMAFGGDQLRTPSHDFR
jgi:error-prone DNA polymerase